MGSLDTWVSLRTETCWVCGVHFGLPDVLATRRGVDGKAFWCPNGCKLAYGKGKLALQAEEYERKLSLKQRMLDTRTEQARVAERSLAATKGHLTRQRKRAKAGVCPCCNRTFQQLARHMKGQHPDFDPTAEVEHG